MLGAIAGAIIGSIYEANNIKTTEFPLFGPGCRFTDDTVLTAAIAEHLMDGADLVDTLHEYFWRYPDAGFGGAFFEWAGTRQRRPYGSWGNGSAMRVSPVGFAAETLDEALRVARTTAAVTHDHRDGILGAQAIAGSIFIARTGGAKQDVRLFVEQTIGCELGVPLDEMRAVYEFDVSCRGSVPPAICAFLESEGYEDCVRKAVSLGGDSDTIACMAGGIAEAYYGGVPDEIAEQALGLLDAAQRGVVEAYQGENRTGPQRVEDGGQVERLLEECACCRADVPGAGNHHERCAHADADPDALHRHQDQPAAHVDDIRDPFGVIHADHHIRRVGLGACAKAAHIHTDVSAGTGASHPSGIAGRISPARGEMVAVACAAAAVPRRHCAGARRRKMSSDEANLAGLCVRSSRRCRRILSAAAPRG